MKWLSRLKSWFFPGYRIWQYHAYLVSYREGKRRVDIAVTPITDTHCHVYVSSTLRWLPPYEHEFISEEKRQQIIERFCKSFFQKRETFELIRIPEIEEKKLEAALLRLRTLQGLN